MSDACRKIERANARGRVQITQDMLAVRGRSVAEIQSYIPGLAAETEDELILLHGRDLKVQTAKSSRNGVSEIFLLKLRAESEVFP